MEDLPIIHENLPMIQSVIIIAYILYILSILIIYLN